MEILNSTINEIDSIFNLYRQASAYQQPRFSVVWPAFDRQMVLNELAECRQWKLIINESVACVWATTFDDPQIWEEQNQDPAVYIHRIATAPEFRGQNMVGQIVSWAKEHAKDNNKKFVRLDTVGENKKLIEHYTRNGFKYLGLKDIKSADGLPAHYGGKPICFFEIEVVE